MKKFSEGLNDLKGLLFPRLCVTCGARLISQEKFVCLNCWHDLPQTGFHLNPANRVAQLFWGRVQVEMATSFFSYKKGSRYQNLIYFIKYKGLKELGYETGKRFGFAVKESNCFVEVDFVVPIPLHPDKEQKRGYNQSEWIARGLADVLQKPVVIDNLYRKIYTSTQTRKNRFERWQNVEGIFGLQHRGEFAGKHILLIDDVVTTGATLEACAVQILKEPGAKVSIATLAFADF